MTKRWNDEMLVEMQEGFKVQWAADWDAGLKRRRRDTRDWGGDALGLSKKGSMDYLFRESWNNPTRRLGDALRKGYMTQLQAANPDEFDRILTGRTRKAPAGALWNNGIGAVTRGKRKGYTKRDQQVALYRCKVAQFESQEGVCGRCGEPMDPMYACWITAKWQNGLSLARWAYGRSVEYNRETKGFDSEPKPPNAILDEYKTGTHYLYHPRCLRIVRPELPGAQPGGPAWEREFKLAIEEGYDEARAFTLAHERLRAKVLANLTSAREDPKRMKNWLSKMERDGKEEKHKYTRERKPRKKKVRQPGEGPEADAALRAEQEARRGEDERLAREEAEFLASMGVKVPG